MQQAKEYIALRSLLEDLDIRASELLQANGVIWVEGPSDRIYVRRWIDLASRGSLQEGVHYSIMFYGGKLLSHLSALPAHQANEAISLLRLNRNLVLMIDSDRRRLKGGTFRADLNETKKRLIREAESVGGYVWVTDGKEIENYIAPRVLSHITSGSVGGVDQYSSVPEAVSKSVGDKISLAHAASAITTEADLDVLDLQRNLVTVCHTVQRWNAL